MASPEQSNTVEAFLLIEQPRQRIGHWTKALAPLDGPGAPPVMAIVAYYDPTCDQAVIDLQYDAAKANLKFVAEVAVLAEVGMVQPAELSEGERARFLSDRLARCTIRVTDQRTIVGALGELVRKIKDTRGNKISTQPPPVAAQPPLVAAKPPPIPPAAKARAPRGDTLDPVMLVNVKGTRDNLASLPESSLLGNGPEPPPPPRQDIPTDAYPVVANKGTDLHRAPTDVHRVPTDVHRAPTDVHRVPTGVRGPRREKTTAVQIPAARREAAREQLSRPDRHRTAPMPAELSQRLIIESSGLINLSALPKPAARTGADQLPGMAGTARDARTSTAPHTRMRAAASTGAHLPLPGEPQQANVIYARYLRSGRWVPARVGALSLKGGALLAGALPRLGDRVDVALTFGSHRALVRGVVGKVSSSHEVTQTGTSTFHLAWELEEHARRQLTSLLIAAREARITIKPPPPRVTRRFPVEWQVALGTIRGAVKATALDVSTQGMFVQPAVALEVGSTLTFSVVLDDGPTPIAGRARVVRQIQEAEAKACGLAPGFGLAIMSLSEADRMRWLGFLARIERRTDKRVLIGADPGKLAELQAALASLGYAVGAAGDPRALIQLAKSEARAADAVLIDARWLQNEASATLVENVFTSRNVPCVTMQGEVRRARQVIDRILDVVA